MPFFTEPLTKDDRTLLTSYTNTEFLKEIIPAFMWMAVIIGAVLFMLLSFLAGWVEEYIDGVKIGGKAVFSVSVLLSFGYCAYYLIKEIRAIKQDASGFQEKLQNDLRNNVKTVETLNVTQYAELEQFEDEGTAFLMVLDDRRLLCVRGQDLDCYAHDAIAESEEGIDDIRHLFPQTQIAYSYAPETQIRLDVKGIGEVMDADSRWFLPTMKNTTYLMEGFYNGTVEEILKQHGYKRYK